MADCFLMKGGNSGTSIIYGENLFNYEEFKSIITAKFMTGGLGVYNGSIEWNDDNQSFNLIASSNNCYTNTDNEPICILNNSGLYELSFDVEGNNGYCSIYFNESVDTNHQIYISTNQTKRIIFSPIIEDVNITICFGVNNENDNCTFSNIQLREVLI